MPTPQQHTLSTEGGIFGLLFFKPNFYHLISYR
jgi:hypothetical protein